MGHIVSVSPGSGAQGDLIRIVVQYDTTSDGSAPDVANVVFAEGVDAPSDVTGRDVYRDQITLQTRVPAGATTGPIEVDLIGTWKTGPREPIGTDDDFKVTLAPFRTFTIRNVYPINPAGGYRRGSELWLETSSAPVPGSQVYFPNIEYGPPVMRVQPTRILMNKIYLTIPNQAQTGRVKVVNGQGGLAALTQILTFTSNDL